MDIVIEAVPGRSLDSVANVIDAAGGSTDLRRWALQRDEAAFRRVVEANRAFAALMGEESAAAFLGRSFVEFVAPDAAAVVGRLFAMVLAGQPIRSTARIRRTDGSVLDIEHRTALAADGIRTVMRPTRRWGRAED